MLDNLPSAATIFANIGISFGLGFLVGLQRESMRSAVAGIRTFPLVSVFGTLCALISLHQGVWILAAGLLAVTLLLILANVIQLETTEPPHPGMTTEMSVAVMYVVGALLSLGHREIAIAVGGGVAVILQLKGELHGFTARLSEDDVHAIMRFALLTLVILPVLPNETFGPYDVLSLRQIWWMVVLIVGIGLGGYIAHKFLRGHLGHALAGVLGGLVSSTATTVTYARRTAKAASAADLRATALVLISASAVALFRVFVEIGVVAPDLLRSAVPPLTLVLLPLAGSSLWLWSRVKGGAEERPEPGNPSKLSTAIAFGLLYALILLATAAVRDVFGERGLVAVAAISGMTDVDAMTLSSARLFRLGQLPAEAASNVVVIAVMANLAFKGFLAALLGGRQLGASIAIPFGAALAGGALALAL